MSHCMADLSSLLTCIVGYLCPARNGLRPIALIAQGVVNEEFWLKRLDILEEERSSQVRCLFDTCEAAQRWDLGAGVPGFGK